MGHFRNICFTLCVLMVSTNLPLAASEFRPLAAAIPFEEVSVRQFGAKGDGKANDTRAFQEAINKGSKVIVPKGRYLISKCLLKSDLEISGQSGAVIVCLDISGHSTQNGTFELDSRPNTNYKNITIRNLTFEVKAPYKTNIYPRCILLNAHNNSSFNNIVFDQLTFRNPSDNAILLLANQAKVGFDNITITRCRAYGSPSWKKFQPANLVRVINNSDPKTNYGIIIAQNIRIANCYAKYLRTLADIKRGCSNVIVENNYSENMHDCHHSIDGSFHCTVRNNTSHMDKYFLEKQAFSGVNFLEVQGENINIINNQVDKQNKHGIFISDYSLPAEGKIAGHPSKNILIRGNSIDSVFDGHGIKVLNGINVTIEDNSVKYCKYYDIAIDSKTGRFNSRSGQRLEADDIKILRNKLSGKGIIDGINRKTFKSNNVEILLKQR